MLSYKRLIQTTLLFTVPALSIHPQTPSYITPAYQPLLLDSSLTYDDVVSLVADLENGDLERKYSPEDVQKIRYFLSYLARLGAPEDERDFIDETIEPLLFTNYSEYRIHTIPSSNDAEIFLCKRKTKKWILIGACILLVVIGAGCLIKYLCDSKEESEPSYAPPSSNPPPLTFTETEKVLEEVSTSFKNKIEELSYKSPTGYELPIEENIRILGSLFGHEAFKNPPIPYPQHTPHTISGAPLELHHSSIDHQFGTAYTSLYNTENQTDFTILSYQLRGEKALESGYPTQAVYELSKAINLDPTRSLPYLERGSAYFALGKYDEAIQDYEIYTSKQPPSSPSEFTLGFAKGLPIGIYDGVKNSLLFLGEFVIHPIDTGEKILTACITIKDLVSTEEWVALREMLAPEVCSLVTEWDTLPSNIRGERAGYIFGKYGADIVIVPGGIAKGTTKAICCAKEAVHYTKEGMRYAKEGMRCAKEIQILHQTLKTVEKNLVLESIAALKAEGKALEVINSSQRTIKLAHEIGYTTPEIAELKKLYKLEETVSKRIQDFADDPVLLDSFISSSRAEVFLEPYTKRFITEAHARDLLEQVGIKAPPRPEGIPQDFKIKITKSGGGIEYIDPMNEHTRIRVMPGKPHSTNPCQQNPYVIYMKDGKAFTIQGQLVRHTGPETHIPLKEFVYEKK